jgi:DNA topoisomerase I
MPESLIIVESPTKVKTIQKYLGPEFTVLASMGHVKDLPKSTLGIDTKNAFAPTYQVIDSRKKVIAQLRKAAAKVKRIYLSPDPDREGEAIAWHIAEELNTDNKQIHRVLFNDLTKNTIIEALKHPQTLDVNKFEAQQTRRLLDRLVGYLLSPILWVKVKRGLSAGRVQSVAVRLICEREEEIKKFVPEEFWNFKALLQGKHPPAMEARLVKINGKKAKVGNEAQAKTIATDLQNAAYVVDKVEKKETRQSPLPPFTTSKLQQEASRRLRFPTKKTMRVAQQLYEGVELAGEGSVGLITYMRTDSVRIADEALREVRDYISAQYDPSYLPEKPRIYANKGKVQDAHEAIRPSSMQLRPQDIKDRLSSDQSRLYQLIWNRFVASQMNPAIFDQTTIDITASDGGKLQRGTSASSADAAATGKSAARYGLRAQGSLMKFPGFTAVYTESREEIDAEDTSPFGTILPDVAAGEPLELISLTPEQKFTQPPSRFTEATLVKELEEKGIGRPSTYATIIGVIQDRDYVRADKGKLYPTELGIVVTDLLVKNFPRILDVDFTAAMENQLDMVEEGKMTRVAVLGDFYVPFDEDLKKAQKGMKNGQPTDMTCEKCGSPMVIKWGRNGRFVACSNYPSCKNTLKLKDGESGGQQKSDPEVTDTPCSVCGKPMVIRGGRFGRFLGCSAYPECKYTANLSGEGQEKPPAAGILTETPCGKCGKPMLLREGKYGKFLGCSGYPACKNIMPIGLGITCPAEGCTGELAEKRTKTGRTFYGCTQYPKCKTTYWDRPLKEACPRCGSPFLLEHRTAKKRFNACPNEGCGYKSETE